MLSVTCREGERVMVLMTCSGQGDVIIVQSIDQTKVQEIVDFPRTVLFHVHILRILIKKGHTSIIDLTTRPPPPPPPLSPSSPSPTVRQTNMYKSVQLSCTILLQLSLCSIYVPRVS